MIEKLSEIRDLLSGELSYDNRAKAREMIDSLIDRKKEDQIEAEIIAKSMWSGKSVGDAIAYAESVTQELKTSSIPVREEGTPQIPNADKFLVQLQGQMTECINKALEYQAVGRKTLDFNSNEKEFYSSSEPLFLYGGNALVNCQGYPFIGEKINPFPIDISGQFTVFSKPVFELNQRVIDECQKRVKRDYEEQENEYIFHALRLMAEKCKKVIELDRLGDSLFCDDSVIDSLARIEGELTDSLPTKLIGSRREIAKIIRWTICDSASCRERLTCNLSGHILTADVHACDKISDADLIVTAGPDVVGQMLVLEPLSVKLEPKDKGICVSYSSTIAIGLYPNTTFILRSV